MNMMIKLLIAAAALLSLTACESTSPGIGSTPPDDFPTQNLSASLDPEQAEIAGEIDFAGFTEFIDPVVSRTKGGTAAAGSTGIMAKIIDPIDDILVTKYILQKGGYRLGFRPSVAGVPIKAKIVFELKVVEDLNGDGVGGDILRQSLPVTLLKGKSALLNLSVRRADSLVVDDVFQPALGELLYTSVTQTDVSGARESYFATVVSSNEVIFDQDGDSVLAPGEDTVYQDADQNSWPDESEAGYGAAPGAAAQQFEGVVAEVDPLAQTLTITVGTTMTIFQVDPFAAIQQIGPDGELLGQLTLERSLTGRTVRIEASGSDATLTAQRILVLPQTQQGKP